MTGTRPTHAARQRPAPMTADGAREVLRDMDAARTKKESRITLLRTAIAIGNLSDGAKAVYAAELARLAK